MDSFVTTIAKRNEVLFRVVTRVTAELLVVNLKLLHRSAGLAPPPIPLKDLVAQLLIGIGV